MTRLLPAQAEEQLRHVTQQFAQWRQSRRSPRGRIPKPLWAQAVALSSVLPLTRVAKHLGLAPQALKRHRDISRSALAPASPLPFPHFVEVSTPWRSPTAEVEVQRPDGTRLRIIYHDASPTLTALLQTFLESR